MALRLLALLAAGDLGQLDPAWEGWHLVNGQLISPENVTFTPGEVRALPYQYALIAELKRDRDRPADADYANVIPWPRPKGGDSP